jgi:hypothetical protein
MLAQQCGERRIHPCMSLPMRSEHAVAAAAYLLVHGRAMAAQRKALVPCLGIRWQEELQ